MTSVNAHRESHTTAASKHSHCGRSCRRRRPSAPVKGKASRVRRYRKARGFSPAACWTFRVSWPWRRCRRLNVASSTGTMAVNEPSGCPAGHQIPTGDYCAYKTSYHISAWLAARPCPRLSSYARSSPRNDIPIDHEIPFDRAAFVLCSTRGLITHE
jgi:hypothetical protein